MAAPGLAAIEEQAKLQTLGGIQNDY